MLARSIGEEEQIPESDDDALLDALLTSGPGIEIFEPLPAEIVEPPIASMPAVEKPGAQDDDDIKIEPAQGDRRARRRCYGS